MKKSLFLIMFALLAVLVVPDASAQGRKVTSSAVGVKYSTDSLLKVFTPSDFISNGTKATGFTVGVLFTSGTAADTVQLTVVSSVYAGILSNTVGEVISDTTSLAYTYSAATEYQEKHFTVSGGVNYIGIRLQGLSGASTGARAQVYIKPDE